MPETGVAQHLLAEAVGGGDAQADVRPVQAVSGGGETAVVGVRVGPEGRIARIEPEDRRGIGHHDLPRPVLHALSHPDLRRSVNSLDGRSPAG
jgi:hypothetical protein